VVQVRVADGRLREFVDAPRVVAAEEGVMSLYARRESWGYSVWSRTVQIAAGVGLDFAAFRLGRAMTAAEARVWRKYGVFRMKQS
jgi:hypothetical protein